MKLTPHDYQTAACAFMLKHQRAALLLDTGLGKTATTLLALRALQSIGLATPALIVAPLKVAVATWPAEIENWDQFAHLRFSVVCGSPKARRAALAEPADVYL